MRDTQVVIRGSTLLQRNIQSLSEARRGTPTPDPAAQALTQLFDCQETTHTEVRDRLEAPRRIHFSIENIFLTPPCHMGGDAGRFINSETNGIKLVATPRRGARYGDLRN